MTREELARKLESMKGLAGSGTVLSNVVRRVADFIGTMEPGDVAAGEQVAMAAPIAYDLWYLYFHQNFLRKFHDDIHGADFNHYNYTEYLQDNLNFLNYLPGLKPLKVYTDLKQQLSTEIKKGLFGDLIQAQYQSNGIYWINTAFFEFKTGSLSFQYPSEGSQGFKTHPNDYVGYIAVPTGQLGVMEVISIFQETDLTGYAFAAYSSSGYYHQKAPISDLEEQYKPTVQSTPEIFPDAKNNAGNALSGKNYCYGRHFVQSAYYRPEKPVSPQNNRNSDGMTAYAPTAGLDVELWAAGIKDYGEDIKPKKWLRYWIHKDSTLPVPGEFIGILVRPVATPPHVWWFQESSPFLYAGNWMETGNLTSGVVKSVTPEGERTDGGNGNLYTVAIQGCEVKISSSDFLEYSVGDRVAVLKVDTIAPASKTFSALQQRHFQSQEKDTAENNYIIIPATFYKVKN